LSRTYSNPAKILGLGVPEKLVGLLLTGIAILTGQLQVLGFFILEYFPSLANIG